MSQRLLQKSHPRIQRRTKQKIREQVAPHRVILLRPTEIQAYLDRHPKLAHIIPKICAQARHEFGEETELALEVYHDPEIDDRYLALYIRQSVYANRILTKIDRVWQPYGQQLARASGYFLVTTDFRPPKGMHGVQVGRVSRVGPIPAAMRGK
jgi:hypothetical protein